MVTHGKITLFRMTASDDTEDSLDDKIEFDGNAMVPDNRSGIMNFRPSIKRRNPDNPLPHANETDKQDTGYSGNTYSFTAYFYEGVGRAGGIAKLRDWIIEDQTIDTLFDNGRIGIRNDFRPEFNLTPNNDSGYKIILLEPLQDLGLHTRVVVSIVLEHSGDPTRFGV